MKKVLYKIEIEIEIEQCSKHDTTLANLCPHVKNNVPRTSVPLGFMSFT